MKKLLLFAVAFIAYMCGGAQPAKIKYPEPEFSNEIYLLKKDSTVMRLEKNSSKMDSKVKMGGIGGAENGYTIEGEKSTVRLGSGGNLSFVFSTGASAQSTSPQNDSVMRANGMDPSMISGAMGGIMDPVNTVTLYKTVLVKGNRKIMLQKSPGMFGSKKISSSDKYTFSVKKIRDGYWELVIDKTLPKGEYAFTTMSMNMGNMDGAITLFAFAVD